VTGSASRRLSRAERLQAAAWGGLVALACGSVPVAEPSRPGPTPARPTPTRTVSTADAAATASAPERAQWVLLPPLLYWLPTFQRTLDVGVLYAGPGNERWLVSEEMPLRGTAPDPVALAGALRVDAGFAFITSRGAVYSAPSPLGELSFSVAPVQAYVDAAAGRDHFLGIDASGRLQRSGDRGQSWQVIRVPPHAGTLSEVEMLQSGAGLLLANHAGKSQLFSTRDDGATWRAVDHEGRRFVRLVSHQGELQPVVSVSREDGYYQYAILDEALARVTEESRVFDSYTPFAHATGVPPNSAMFMVDRAPAPGVAAPPLRWVALRDLPAGPLAWEISVVPFGERPVYRRADGPVGCALGRAAVVSEIAVVCWHPGTAKASLFVGEDDVHSFRKHPLPHDPRALYALGDALVVQTPCDGKQTRGPFLLEPPTWQARRVQDDVCRTHLAFTRAAEPDTFLSVAWSNSELTLHRWRASDAHAITRPELVSTIAAAVSEPTTRVALAGEGATVVVAVPTPRVWPAPDPETLPAGVLFRSDDAGQRFSEVALPTAFLELGLSGRRGFGVGHDGQGWTTHDFGEAWTKVWAPRQTGWRSIECNDAGCLTARGLRIGWGR